MQRLGMFFETFGGEFSNFQHELLATLSMTSSAINDAFYKDVLGLSLCLVAVNSVFAV